MKRNNFLYLVFVLCFGMYMHMLTPAFAASFNQQVVEGGYEKGQIQQSPAVQQLEKEQAQGLHMPNDAAMHELDNTLDDYGDMPSQSVADPLEPWNRFWFGFNDILYLYVLNPVYGAYDYVTPDAVQGGLSNFLDNLLFPVRFVNSILQGKFLGAGVEFGHFFVNSTVGMAGFIDVAKDKKGVVPIDPTGEDFGQTLGVWGMGEVFYLVWPVLGPSSLRDTLGTAGDYALSPGFYFNSPFAVKQVDLAMSWTMSSANGFLRFNDLGPVLDLYEDTKQLAVDPYVATREAYTNYRRSRIQQ